MSDAADEYFGRRYGRPATRRADAAVGGGDATGTAGATGRGAGGPDAEDAAVQAAVRAFLERKYGGPVQRSGE